MSDVFMLDGATLNLVTADALPVRCRESFGRGPPTFQIRRRAILPPTEVNDPWMGKSWQWINTGTTYFNGVFRSRSLRRGDVGWVIDYQAIGIADDMDKFPITDATTGLDVSPFNCPVEDLINYRPASAGRHGRPDHHFGSHVARQRREHLELWDRELHRPDRRRLRPAGRYDRRPGGTDHHPAEADLRDGREVRRGA